jgi:1-acyl-sn-glycerol-3-phosphate acyltransferase
MRTRTWLKRQLVSKELDKQFDAIEKPVGSMGYDPWGFNRDTNKIAAAVFSPLFRRYFRVVTTGIERVPATGPVLLVANHSGQLPIDGVLIGFSMATRQVNPRLPRAMVERFFGTVPFLGNLLNQMGGVLGDPVNCASMLDQGEAVIVFPEGVRGSGKPWGKRYQLQHFGEGFVHLAMKYKAPIIPIGVIGCEETIPSLTSLRPLAKLLGVPYVPVCLPAVLPAKVHIHYGEPIVFADDDADESEIGARARTVKNAIDSLLREGLTARKSIFF